MPGLLSRRAFLRRPEPQRPEPATPRIAAVAASCLGVNRVACGICADPCDARAIRIRPLQGGRSLPVVDAALCNGCGDCLSVCPVQALSLIPFEPETSACA